MFNAITCLYEYITLDFEIFTIKIKFSNLVIIILFDIKKELNCCVINSLAV